MDAAAGVAADRSTMRFTTALAPAAITNTPMSANTMAIGDIVGGGDGMVRRSERNEGVGFEIGAVAAGRLCVDGENAGDDRGSGTDKVADVCGAKRRISRASGESEPLTIGIAVATVASNDEVARSSTCLSDASGLVGRGATVTGPDGVDANWSATPLSSECSGVVGIGTGGCGGLVSAFAPSLGMTAERSEERRRTT